MTKEMTWEDYCLWIIDKAISKYGGMRNMQKMIGLDSAITSKIKNRHIIPTKEFIKKWFPDEIIPEFTAVVKID